jgi:heme acquisition protein HasR
MRIEGKKRRLPGRAVCVVAIGLAGCGWAAAGVAQQVAPDVATAASNEMAFDIPAQALGSAVISFAEQSGLQVFFDSRTLAGLRSTALKGRYAPRDGLAQLLGGAPVSYQFGEDRRVSLQRLPESSGALELGTLRVQARQADDWLYEAPRSVTAISREQLDRNPPRHAADMLEESPGVYSAVSQQDPGLSVNIRGIQDYGRVNMSVDGMRQNFQQSGHQQRNGTMYIDPELLAGVTIEKGATSGMGGAGVIGGVADFRTLDARDFIHEGKEFGGRIRATSGLGGDANGTDFIGSGVFALGNDIGDILFAASERHLGDYDPGTHGSIGELRTGSASNPAIEERIKNTAVDYSGSTMRSRLAKLGLNLPFDQRLQFSYLRTQVSYADANMMDVADAELWEKLGDSNVVSQNFAVDYSYAPDNPLVDFKAKLYYVDNRNDQSTLTRGTTQGYSITYQTDTYGLQAQNTSTFMLGDTSTLKANYGLEFFYDKVRPESDQTIVSSSPNDFPYSEGMTPEGSRAMGSLFARLDYEHDGWLNLNAGLRYDRYRLRGETGMNIRTFYLDGSNQQYNLPLLYDVDREEGRFSPTFGIGIKPGLDWLQLFASYGKGWRPPAVTESLISGRPHGGGVETMYPNPFLEPERSKSLEVGFNVLRQNLFTQEDRLGIKVAYFDTRIDDFMYMGYGLRRPGYDPIANIGTVAYVNNLETTRFRGVEYSLDYDAGGFYGNLSYTHMIGSNDYCKRTAWLGGVESPVYGTGGRRPPIIGMEPDELANALINCGGIMGTAEHMPMDRGSLTLGARLLDRTLDVGVRARYSEGFSMTQEDVEADGSYTYPADWKQYTVYDLFGSYKASDALTLRLALENVTDRAYLVPLGDVLAFTLGRGRTLQGTLEYTF